MGVAPATKLRELSLASRVFSRGFAIVCVLARVDHRVRFREAGAFSRGWAIVCVLARLGHRVYSREAGPFSSGS